MESDTTINFGVANVGFGYSAITGVIDLSTNHGLKLPSAIKSFFAVWWNYTDFPDPNDDPNKEVVKVYKKVNDKLYIQRGRQGTIPSDKNIAGKAYRIAQFFDEEKFNKQLVYFKNPNQGIYYFHDFENAATVSASLAFDSFGTFGSSSGNLTSVTSPLGKIGVMEMTTGNTGSASNIRGLGNVSFMKFLSFDAEMAAWIMFPYLIGENSKRFNFAVGFGNGSTSATISLPNGGALFTYAANNGIDSTIFPHQWRFVIRDNTTTIINEILPVQVKPNIWYELRIKTFKEDICEIYINKTLIKRYIGQLPKIGGANSAVSPLFAIGQNTSLEGEVRIDAFEFKANFRKERTPSVNN